MIVNHSCYFGIRKEKHKNLDFDFGNVEFKIPINLQGTKQGNPFQRILRNEFVKVVQPCVACTPPLQSIKHVDGG